MAAQIDWIKASKWKKIVHRMRRKAKLYVYICRYYIMCILRIWSIWGYRIWRKKGEIRFGMGLFIKPNICFQNEKEMY